MTEGTDRYRGYRGPCRELMEREGFGVWSEVEMDTTRGKFEGLVLPRSETSDDLHIVLKLTAATTSAFATIRCVSSMRSAIARPITRFPKRRSQSVRTSPT